jgi:hypothetical protein
VDAEQESPSPDLCCPDPLQRPAHDRRQARRPVRRFRPAADRVRPRAVGDASVVVRRRAGALATQLLHAGSDRCKIVGSSGTRGSGEHRSQTRKGGTPRQIGKLWLTAQAAPSTRWREELKPQGRNAARFRSRNPARVRRAAGRDRVKVAWGPSGKSAAAFLSATDKVDSGKSS